MTFFGIPLNSFDFDFLKGPRKVVVSKDKNYIYISRYSGSTKTFIKMDWQGNVVKTFEEENNRGPCGIQELDDGSFLVCYRNSNTIVRLSSDCQECELTCLENEILCQPQAIAYCKNERKLYML